MGIRGLALLLVVGVLGILGVLATAFVTLARLERRASLQRLHATKALLLARSGVEDALARLSAGQEASYGGEDWNADGALSAGPEEAQSEVYRPGILDTDACPARHAVRPSFFRSVGGNPRVVSVGGRLRGYTGRLSGDADPEANHYALKVEDLNARIFVNGGALGSGQSSDVSNNGPNGFLVRLLSHLDEVMTGTSDLGAQILSVRPASGYLSLEDLRAVLGNEYETFKAYLTVHAWVDPKVVKPQPMDGRPQRFLDIDDAHRIGTYTPTVAGAPANPGISGDGSEAYPWTETIPLSNFLDTTLTNTVSWERGFVYAWRQLRLAPPDLEPRAPVAVNSASVEVLASVFLGLKGTHLETWDGSAGFDGGFGWCVGSMPYSYPDPGTEETPWIRTRVDYGMGYGTASRPWYGPRDYNPTTDYMPQKGKPLVAVMPLGRLKETAPVTLGQARAIADAIRGRVTQKGPFRTWAEFNGFVDALPLWEDADGDAALDGVPYDVTASDSTGMSLLTYPRRRYEREDVDSDGVMELQTFSAASGSWATSMVWKDVSSDPSGVPGLTRFQKDVLKAMANPNTDLNDFNPDANLYKDIDKTDVAGIPGFPGSYVHTAELSLGGAGYLRVEAAGRILGRDGRVLALRSCSAVSKLWELHGDTTQADFMQDYNPGSQPPAALFALAGGSPYPLAGGQPLVSYPEPQTLEGGGEGADASYDGQVGLGFIGAVAAGPDTLRGDLFDTLDATGSGDIHAADQRGPYRKALVRPAPLDVGNLFPDGAYSEKDAALKFPVDGIFPEVEVDPFDPLSVTALAFYISCWVKPGWLPESSPRPHALVSLSPAPGPPAIASHNPYGILQGQTPFNDIRVHPFGCFFVPARNNYSQDAFGLYNHLGHPSRGGAWPSRCLLWGAPHCFSASDSLQVRGILNRDGAPDPGWWPPDNPLPAAARPMGRLEAHRWVHLALVGKAPQTAAAYASTGKTRMVLGRARGSSTPGWDFGFSANIQKIVTGKHRDGTANHLRFGEIAAEHNMNYTADATFALVRAGGVQGVNIDPDFANPIVDAYEDYFLSPAGPGSLGRYAKEDGAAYTSPGLPQGVSRGLRVTWTEIPCDLWFDGDNNGTNQDGWMGDPANGPIPRNDQFGPGGSSGPDGRRDVRIRLEIWDDSDASKPQAVYEDPAAANPVPAPLTPASRLYYKAVFVNDWNDATRLANPLDVTPFLDDVTITYLESGGPRILAWSEAGE